MKPTNRVKEQQLVRIRELLDKGKKAKEIAELLSMNYRTVDTRIREIRMQDKDNWKEIAIDSLEERAYKILESLQFCIGVNEDICKNSKDDKARIEASRMVVDTNVALYQFLERGPLVLGSRTQQQNIVKKYNPDTGVG